MFSEKQVKNNWNKIKFQVLNKWNKLSEAEVEKTQGSPRSLSKLVHEHYGKDEDFSTEFKHICEASIKRHLAPQSKTKTASIGQPYRSPNMTDGWKAGQGMQTSANPQTGPESAAGQTENVSANQAADSTWSYQSDDLHSKGPVSARQTTDFQQSTEHIISDRSYSEAPDEFSPNQGPSSTREDIPQGGIHSSAKNSSAHNAAFSSFEDHSRNTKKL